MAVVSLVMREAFRREVLPPPALHGLAASTYLIWLREVARCLRPHLGDEASPFVQEVVAATAQRRRSVLREQFGLRDDDRSLRLAFAVLYNLDVGRKGRWLLNGLGGAPRGLRERAEGRWLVRKMSAADKWREVATHVGEFLIVATELLPKRIKRANAVLGSIFFEMGVAQGEIFRARFAPGSADPEVAIEALRIGEYIFHVNPRHSSGHDRAKRTGFIEGNACLWHTRPGWGRLHCGIFGRFQEGMCATFGLSYELAQTIPKHGGDSCTIVMNPIPLGRRRN